MRVLLVMWLAFGLIPGLGEIAETAVHLVSAGHLAHSDADHGDLGDQGTEHGCGATLHHCGCCGSQVVTQGPAVAQVAPYPAPEDHPVAAETLVSLAQPAPPHRPPIAS